jgi:hypothetical protein
MTVAELIEALAVLPPDAPVELFTFNVPGLGDGIWSAHPVENVEATDEWPDFPVRLNAVA